MVGGVEEGRQGWREQLAPLQEDRWVHMKTRWSKCENISKYPRTTISRESRDQDCPTDSLSEASSEYESDWEAEVGRW